MNGRYVQILAILASCALLTACTTIPEVGPVQQSQVDQLSTGINQETINILFEDNLPKHVIHHQYDAADYQVSVYDLVIGYESELDFNCEVIRLCLPVEVDVPITTEYLLIQKLPDLTLSAWGTLADLANRHDAKVNALMLAVKEKLATQNQVD